MPVNWTPELDLKLLLLLLDTADFKPRAVWPLVAEALGDGISGEAVRQHYQKLKKTAASLSLKKDGDGAEESAATPTPKKRKSKLSVVKDEDSTKPGTPIRKRGKSKAAIAAAATNSGNEEDVTASTPAGGSGTPPLTKKRRVSRRSSTKAVVKDEPTSSPIGDMLPDDPFTTLSSPVKATYGGAESNKGDVDDDELLGPSDEQLNAFEG